MYEGYYLNFISAISRQKLEDLALSAIQNNAVASVAKVNTNKFIKHTRTLADHNVFAWIVFMVVSSDLHVQQFLSIGV